MSRLSKLLLTVISVLTLLLETTTVQGSMLNGAITGDNVQWKTAEKRNGNTIAARFWDLSIHLPAANKVIPAGPDTASQSFMITLKNTNNANDTVLIPIEISGMEYKLTANNVTTENNPTGTANSILAGNTVTVSGVGMGKRVYSYSQAQTPFSHYRPIIKLSDFDLVSAFKKKSAPGGKYQGQHMLRVPYEYYRDGILIRNTLSIPIIIVIDYSPAVLKDIKATGTGEMQVFYYGYPKTLVGGKTIYTIEATGVFPSGIKVGLQGGIRNQQQQYVLTTGPKDATSIPYSVTCPACTSGTKIIENGIGMIDGINGVNTLTIPSNGQSKVTSTIVVSFKDKPLDELNNGNYRGTFILVFAAKGI